MIDLCNLLTRLTSRNSYRHYCMARGGHHGLATRASTVNAYADAESYIATAWIEERWPWSHQQGCHSSTARPINLYM